MKPFQIGQQKKNIKLERNKFNLKEFFSKLIQSPDKMYPKLLQMLNKNSDTLHAFIQLGGLSKIYEWLTKFYSNNDKPQIMKWLHILNHPNFPTDTELIKQIGLGNFINKQIKSRYNNMGEMMSITNAIEHKWYSHAKHERERHKHNRKKVSFPSDSLFNQIIFARNDKPSKIAQMRAKTNEIRVKSRFQSSNDTIRSYTKDTSEFRPILRAFNENINVTLPPSFVGMYENEGGNGKENEEYTLEYMSMEDNDICMGDSPESTDIENSEEMKAEMEWKSPQRMRVDSGYGIRKSGETNTTPGVREEEERLKKRVYNGGSECVELNVVKDILDGVSLGCGASVRKIPTTYPYWSEIQKYRKEHGC